MAIKLVSALSTPQYIQFQNSSGTNTGKIEASGDDLIITNSVGNVLFGDLDSNVYIGDGVNSVDMIFEQSGAIRGETGSSVTLTIGSSNTTLNLYNPNLADGASLTSTLSIGTGGVIDFLPDTGAIINLDGQTILKRNTFNGGITLGHDDAVIIAGGDTYSVMESNLSLGTETVFIGAEGGLEVYAFPNNDTSWSNRKIFTFSNNSNFYLDGSIYPSSQTTNYVDSTRIANWQTAYGWGNHASAGYLTSETYSTASELLTAIKTVDGSGSGLDADTLDGINSGSFLRSDVDDTFGNASKTLTIQGVVRSDNNANTSGPNFNVSTTNKSTAEYAYRVDRSGTVVGGIKIGGQGVFADGLTVGSAYFTASTISNWNTAYGWGDHSTQSYATTGYVTQEINNLIDSAPGALNTLNELAAALGDDANFSTTVSTALGNRLEKSQNLSDVANVATARTNLGLGTAAVEDKGYFASASHTQAWSTITSTPTTLAGYGITDADNYVSWNLKTNNVQRTTVQSGGTLDIVAGTNVSVSYSAGGVVTIASTDTNTDTNYYVDGLSFDTGNGVLTASVSGATNQTVDLDGRYVEIGGDTMTGDLNLGDNNLNAVENIYLDNAIYSQADTNTYTQFHSADQWRVVTGGGERLEVTNTHTYLQNILYLNSDLNTSSSTNVNYGNINTTSDGTIVRGGFLNPASEGNMVHLPHNVNDLAGFNHWGTITVSGLYKTRSGTSGSYTYSNPVTTSDFDNGAAFDSYSSTAGSWYSDDGADGSTAGTGVITLEWTYELTYSAWVGIVFGSGSFTAKRVKIEAYRGGAWQTLCDLSNNTSNVVLRQIGSNGGAGSATTKLRYTLGGSVNNSYFRIHTLYAANYRAGDNNISGISTDVTRGVHFLEKYKTNYTWGSFIPATDSSYTLGNSGRYWTGVYADKIYLNGTDTNTTSTTALVLNGTEVEKRTLGSNAFTSTNIPQNVSELTNDAGYITDGNTGWNNSYGFITASSTDTLTNKSGNISQWTNDSGYITSLAGYATETYVNTAVSNLVASAPAALDTLNELAAALGDDANFSTTMSTALGNRLRVDTASQGLTSTQKSNARTNLGLGTAATLASTYFLAAGSNLSDLGDAAEARTNLGLGTAATTASTAYATAAQGTNADTAYGWGNHASAGYLTTVAFGDITGTPTTIAGYGITDAFDGAYSSLTGAPTNVSSFTNDAGYITDGNTNWNNSYGFITASDSITGNAATATKLATARNIALNGDVSGNADFDGSGNITITTVVADDSHNHTIANVDGLQTALDGKASSTHNHNGTYAYYNDFRSLGVPTFTAGGGSNTTITTAQLIAEMEGDGAFDSYTSAFKTSWSYAGNDNLSDAGNFTETAGTSWLTWTDNSNDTTRGNVTALAIAPNTGGSAGRVFIYNDQGSSYSPGWREVWTNVSLDPVISATASNDTITFTRANGGTFSVSTSDANTNYYLDGITKSGNTLTFSVNGTTNQSYAFGSNAFTSYTDHSTQGYLTTVAFGDITGTPTTISGYGITDAFDGNYNSLANLPTLFDGAFSSLSSKPTTLSGYGITDAVASSTYTASDVLSKLLTVDGAGSLLDADTLDGSHKSDFASSSHTHSAATTSANGFMSSTDKTKLDGITANADVTPSWVPSTDPGYLTAHPNITAASSVNNSGRTYIQDITVDSNGHITGITSATETVTNTNTTYSAGSGLDLTGTTFSVETDLRDGITHVGINDSNYITFNADSGYIDFYAGDAHVARLESDGDLHIKGDVIAFSSLFG